MTSGTSEPGDAAQAALAEMLGTTEIDIVAETAARLPSGEEVRLVHAAVRGQPNRTASVAVDAAGAVHPPRRFEALAGRELFWPEAHVPERPVEVPTAPITIDPPANELTLPECATQRETVTVNVPESGLPPKADVYLLADTTGSMGSIIGAVQAGIGAVVADPAFAGFDVAWGAGNYKDFPIPASSPYAFQHQLAPTPGAADVTLAVNTWTASDGLDTPEGQLFALQQIATDPAIGWRPDSKRILVWFGDAPGHDPVCAAISGVADITETTARDALVAAGITVVAISTDTGTAGALDGDPTIGSFDYGACTVGGTAGQAGRITAATPGGSHTTGVDAASMIATLVSLVSSAVHTIGRLELRPTGGIAPFVTSITPSGYNSLPGDVPHTLQFEVTWTGVRECADNDEIFTGSLDVVADGIVLASKPVRITVPACRWHHSVEMICGTQKGDDHGNDHDDDHGNNRCQTVVDGRYATAVTIYNPSTCTVRFVKYFAPLILHGDPVGREPRTVRARPFARVELAPGEATLEDCCTLEEAVGPTGGPLVLGVLDIVADNPLDVTVTHTANGAGRAATSINARTIKPRRA
jgi:Integrin beta chain VWA domain